jgi:hypothetical protein
MLGSTGSEVFVLHFNIHHCFKFHGCDGQRHMKDSKGSLLDTDTVQFHPYTWTKLLQLATKEFIMKSVVDRDPVESPIFFANPDQYPF